ncbi:hypothetical protein PFISCL1PPCAC_21593, partial [Pristionchus fissidentatus]
RSTTPLEPLNFTDSTMLRSILIATLCLAAVFAVEAEKKNIFESPRGAFCSPCERIVTDIETAVEKGEPGLLQHCENLCDELLGHIGSLAQQCKDWIDKDFNEIMEKLNNDWTPEAICHDMHLC